jgi:hypothetical protein
MRWATICLIGVCFLGQLHAQEPKKDTKSTTRYGIQPNVELYPQSTPKEALGSVLKAIDAGRLPYLLAQLADPPCSSTAATLTPLSRKPLRS